MKKLCITVEGRVYDVLVEVLEDDGLTGASAAPVLGAAPAAPLAATAMTAAAPVTQPTPAAAPAAGGGAEEVCQVSGMVVSVDGVVGQRVEAEQRLITIEAMKMNTYIHATRAGTVTEVAVTKGSSVLAGTVVARIS